LVRSGLVLGLLGLLVLGLGPAGRAQDTSGGREPVRLLFDTDIGPDVDDAGAVAALNALADQGKVRLLGMACCTSSEWGAPCLDALNTYYGRPDIPIGTFKGGGFLTESAYNRQVAEKFPNDLKSGLNAEDATALYRRILAREADGSVVMCAVGPLNNMARLLTSLPDQYSPLEGRGLVAQKVKLFVSMGGKFPSGKEFNFYEAGYSTQRVVDEWPTPVIFSGFEIGDKIFTGKRLDTETPADNPVRAAYALFPGVGKDRESWDITAAVAAVEGPGIYWSLSGPGKATMDPATGANGWFDRPTGKHRYLVAREPIPRVKDGIESLMVRPPTAREKSTK
jgi:hypothetical protein